MLYRNEEGKLHFDNFGFELLIDGLFDKCKNADGIANIKNITVMLLGAETGVLMFNIKGFIKMESGCDEAINRKRARLLLA